MLSAFLLSITLSASPTEIHQPTQGTALKLCSTWVPTKIGGYFRFHRCRKPPNPTPSCKSCPGQPQVEPILKPCEREVEVIAPEWSAWFCSGELSAADLRGAIAEMPAPSDLALCVEDHETEQSICESTEAHPWCFDPEGGCGVDCCILSILENACCYVLGECCLGGE